MPFSFILLNLPASLPAFGEESKQNLAASLEAPQTASHASTYSFPTPSAIPLNQPRFSNALSMRHSLRTLQSLAATLLILRTTLALPTTPEQSYPFYDYGIDRNTILKQQTSTFYPITGTHTGSGPNGSTPLRLEVRELQKDPTTWTLYILGLDMLQYTPQTEMLSWYQIAGRLDFYSLPCFN